MSSLSALKEQFDKVMIRYTEKSCEVLLVKGLKCYTGMSKCHENDNFNRKLGRTIALGRAEFASKLDKDEKLKREHIGFAEGGAKYTISRCLDINEVDECIISFFPKKQKVS